MVYDFGILAKEADTGNGKIRITMKTGHQDLTEWRRVRARFGLSQILIEVEPPASSAPGSMTFFARQRRDQIARLRAMIAEAKAVQDATRAIALAGDLAILESQAFDAGEGL